MGSFWKIGVIFGNVGLFLVILDQTSFPHSKDEAEAKGILMKRMVLTLALLAAAPVSRSVFELEIVFFGKKVVTPKTGKVEPDSLGST